LPFHRVHIIFSMHYAKSEAKTAHMPLIF
jgi:hypothetical protein